MRTGPHPKQMIVEGQDDIYAIAQLLGHYVEWPNERDRRPIDIVDGKSVSEIMNRSYLNVMLRQSGLECLSIVLDADEDLAGRWGGLRSLLLSYCPGIPENLPKEGLIETCPEGLRLGVWIMPDNNASGMLETFLATLIPAAGTACWEYTEEVMRAARGHAATYRDVHYDKARIHTWLALQDPPGERFGNAVVQSILDPNSGASRPFVDWCRKLYGLV